MLSSYQSTTDEGRDDGDAEGRRQRLVIGMVLILIAAVGHSHVDSFSVPFHFDDHKNITESAKVLSFADDGDWSGIRRDNRPFGLWTLAMNFKLHGEEVWGYHLVSFGLHLASAGLVFWLTQWAIRRRGRGFFTDSNVCLWTAWGIALLWGTHPLSSQSVIYIVQRFELLAAFFALLSIAGYCLIVDGRRWAILLVAVSGLLGMLSKEPAAMIPMLLVLWDRTFCQFSPDLEGHSPADEKMGRRWRWAAVAASLLPYAWFLPSVARWMLPPEINGGSSGSVSMGFRMSYLSPWDYLRTQPEVMLHYLRLAIWPENLCFDYGWKVQTNPLVYWPLVILFATVFLTGCFLWWRRRVAGFLMLVFFVYLAPSSSIVPIADLAVEHRMYLPLLPVLVGIALLVIQGVRLAFRAGLQDVDEEVPDSGDSSPRPLPSVVLVGVLIGVVAMYGWTTRRRCDVYRSPLLLWQDTLAKRPDNARANQNVGSILLYKEDRPDAALPHLKNATAMHPIHGRWWFNLAECYRQLGQDEPAIQSAKKAITLEPDMSRAHNLIGIVRLGRGNLREAADALRRADELGEPSAKFNLATAHLRNRDFSAAIKELESMIRLRPQFKQSHRRLAWVLATATDATIRDGRRASDLLVNDFQIETSDNPFGWDAYAAALAETGDFQAAVKAAGRGIELARQQNNQALARAMEYRCEGYRRGQPHREHGLDQTGDPTREVLDASAA
ncbi:MAG: tetratricopeptide repeat protein [Planctomycetota bacterium]